MGKAPLLRLRAEAARRLAAGGGAVLLAFRLPFFTGNAAGVDLPPLELRDPVLSLVAWTVMSQMVDHGGDTVLAAAPGWTRLNDWIPPAGVRAGAARQRPHDATEFRPLFLS
jgi:hypothetical protein